MAITTFRDAEAALKPFWPANMPRQAKRPAYSLEHIRSFMTFIGAPQDTYPVIHIAGTSGKTSTAYYAASLLQAAGKRVGLLTSPHIHALNERAQINLQPLPEAEFCAELALFLDALERSGVLLAYAELLYAFAFWEFGRQRLDCIVVEVGLGGRLDPTNVISREDKICIITDIGYDHVHILGRTLPEIAAQKAGIIGLHNAVFTYRQDTAITDILRQAAKANRADLHIVPATYQESFLQKLPAFQRRNSYLALQAVSHMLARDGHAPLTAAQVAKGVAVAIPGRMEIRRWKGKTIILDGAHNAQKVATLLASIAEQYPARPLAVAVAFGDTPERTASELLQPFQHITSHMITTTIPAEALAGMHPSRSAMSLLAAARQYDIPSQAIPQLREALQALLHRPEPLLLVTGSLYQIDPAGKLLDLMLI